MEFTAASAAGSPRGELQSTAQGITPGRQPLSMREGLAAILQPLQGSLASTFGSAPATFGAAATVALASTAAAGPSSAAS
jgi:hypothetical protein